jgi:predicted nucleic acid-binding protein
VDGALTAGTARGAKPERWGARSTAAIPIRPSGTTGVIYALADRADAWHAYLLRYRVNAGAELAFTASLGRGELAIEDLTRRDLKRAEQLMSTYDGLGLVNATVIAIAERLKLTTIATTDRRHFAVVRPAHVARFTLVP